MQYNYNIYNREERNICAHLFRILLEPKDNYYALSNFTGKNNISNFNIFTEVALIRDAYFIRKSSCVNKFLDSIVQIIMKQEGVTDCKLYSQLPSELNNPKLTHPKQIKYKGKKIFTLHEMKVYGSLQGMFNAKPDLLICLPDEMLIYEAKYTLDFDQDQIRRTNNIAEIWSNIIYSDLGYNSPPPYKILKLGLDKYKPDISWEKVKEIVSHIYNKNDYTLKTINSLINNGFD